jgi:hypothetical protein
VSIDSLLSTPVGHYVLDEIVRRDITVAAIAAISETDLYQCVTAGAAEASSAKFRNPPVRIFPWNEVTTLEAVTALSDAALASEAARWWSSLALDRAQLWIGAQHAVPQPANPSPRHYDKPPNEIWTSSALADGTSAWWPLLREGADRPPPTETQSVWRLMPSPDARVFEIRSAQHYAWLRNEFGDWDAIAREYDGIHLTVEGLIRAQVVACGSVMLDNWDAESTAWLRWCFDGVERVGELEPDGVHISTPVRHNPVRRGFSSLRARRKS